MDRQMLAYNNLDIVGTKRIEEAIWGELETGGYGPIYEQTEQLLAPLIYMSLRGLRIDQEGKKAAVREAAEASEKKLEELHRICGRALNPLSPRDCMAYFYIEKNIAPYLNRKTGKATTDDMAMQRLAKGTSSRKGLPEAKLVQEVRALSKMSGTYFETELDADGRLRCSTNPRGTTTGRISTSKTIYQTGMNLQNQPPAFKKFIIPDEGKVFIELDKAGAEWIVVAYLSDDANMIRVAEEGKDPHLYTSHLMFGVPEERIKKENEIIGHYTDASIIQELREEYCPWTLELGFLPRNMSMRQAGKKSNHGLNYDESYKRFAIENEMVEGDAKRVVNLYHRSYPGVQNIFHQRVQHQLSKDRTLTNCFGRPRKFLSAWGSKLFKSAYAFLPQSTVGDIVNRAIIDIYNNPNEQVQKGEMLIQVHDSILAQYDIDDVEGMAVFIRSAAVALNPILEYRGREFQIRTDVKMGYTWASLKDVQIGSSLQQTEGSIRKILRELKTA